MQVEVIYYSLIIVGLLLAVMATGTWIAISLYGVGIFALTYLGKGGMAGVLDCVLFNSVSTYTLVAMPLFVFMGEILIRSGCSDSLFKGLKKVLGPFPGGLLHTNIAACSIFAACSGSSTATTVAVGGISYPELTRQGYAKGITLGTICAGGTLGILIPPSIMMILYGSLTGNSIGQLFIAGVIPGVTLALLFMIYIAVACAVKKGLAPPRTPFVGFKNYLKDVMASFVDIWPVVLLIVGIMFSIYGGYATPTEAGAVAVLISLFLWIFKFKTFTLALFNEAVKNTIIVNAQLMISIVGARALGMALSLLNIPSGLSNYVGSLPVNRYIIWATIILIYIIMGCLVDGIDLLIITVPVFYPIMVYLGFDPIWFGVVLTILLEMSLITPPVGFNIYITHGISKEDNMMTTIKGTIPFVGIMLISIVLLTIFPILATYLPYSMR